MSLHRYNFVPVFMEHPLDKTWSSVTSLYWLVATLTKNSMFCYKIFSLMKICFITNI